MTYPANFIADCAAGTLPAVSWVLAPFLETEHPPTPLVWGEFAVGQALQALAANTDLWSKSVMFLTWDDSGGFFDHVPPPVPPPGTPGEFLTATPPVGGDGGIHGPIGLGFRVPALVISPFSRNPVAKSDPAWQPMVCSDLLDHTSPLRFLKSLFVSKGKAPAAVELPYDTTWRRAQAGGTGVGDLTTALNLAAVNATTPTLPYRSASDVAGALSKQECLTALGTEVPGVPVPGYPIPGTAALPTQDPGTARRPSGSVACTPAGSGPPPNLLGVVVGAVTNTVNVVAAAVHGLLGGAAGLGLWWSDRVDLNQPQASTGDLNPDD